MPGRRPSGLCLLALALFLSTAVAGCVHTARLRDRLVVVQTQDFPSLDPIFVSGAGGQSLATLLFSYLLKIDDRGRLVPDVATAVPSRRNGGISADGTTIVYHLRPDVRFSDGVPLTSADVAFTIRTIANPRSDAPSRLGFDDVLWVQTPDPLTVRVRLRAPFAPVLTLLCAPGSAVPILPEHLLRGHVRLGQLPFSEAPIGSGPYVVRSWKREDSLELTANQNYFGGAPHIRKIELRFAAASSTALTMLRSGDADAYVNADDTQFRELKSIPEMRVESFPIDGTGALIFNTHDPVMSDPRVRRAFAESFGARELIDKALLGASRARDPGLGLFQWAYDPRAFAMPHYDPNDAARLLNQAGWRSAPGGIRERDGRPLATELIVRADKPTSTVMATAIQAAERSLGFEVTIRRLPVALLVAPPSACGPLYGGRYGVALFPFIGGFDPDVTDQFACNRIPPNGFNKARYCNPQLDAIMRDASLTFDRSRRIADYRRIQAILAHDLPMVALYQLVSIDAFPRWLHGQTSAIDTPFWNVAAWYLTKPT